MRSTDTSGVGVRGFGHSQRRSLRLPALGNFFVAPFHRLAAELSPVTLAVAITALLAAGLSVAVDTTRTLDEIGSTQPGPTVTMAAGEIGGSQTASPFDAVWQRGAGAFGLALLAIAATLRRRPAASNDRAHFESFLATIPVGVACWTHAGKLAVCNDQYRARLDAEGPALRPGASYPASISRLVHGGYLRLLREDDSNRVIELHREDGTCLLVDERPLTGGGFVTLVTDITERRQTDHLLAAIREEQRLLARRYHEEKLRAEAASRSKTSFLAHLSHDIRTPLNHIIGFAEMMRQQTYGPLGDARYLGYVESMKASGERLLSFFASILELAELESGLKSLQQQPFVVDDLLATVSRRFSAQAQRAGLSLTVAAPSGVQLVGDCFSLERMLGNLVENAIRFTPSGGKVTLAAFPASDGVVLEVTDTGIGMSAERLETLSQPFVFGDAAFTREHSSAGLGIAIARAIAELSGGRLAIDSRPALGTTVAISLPLPKAGEQAVAA